MREHMKSRKSHISVIIPVLNESRTIGKLVTYVLKNKRVGEVLVVDDGSLDDTPEVAERSGARVITSSLLGKGASMEDGMLEALYPTILYLDGDLHGLNRNLIDNMTDPILAGTADFVKARFSRIAGRVTVLTAKPLLETYFPEIYHINQPLGGIMAARKELLQQLRYEIDYGVDIGLLIDATALCARIVEVDIGRLEHDSQPLNALGDMAVQVTRAIIERAGEWGRLQIGYVRRTRENARRKRAACLDRIISLAKPFTKMALVDMDGTLIKGRFIIELARATRRMEELSLYLDRYDLTPLTRMRKIAAIFKGVHQKTFIDVARKIPLNSKAIDMVVGLRKRGYLVGVCTDSYHIAGSIIRRRVFADFCIANMMKFHHERASGQVEVAPAMRHHNGCKRHPVCKLNVLKNITSRLQIKRNEVLVIGDSENDICLLKAVDSSFAFQPKSPEVAQAAKFRIDHLLTEVLNFI